MTDGSKTEEKWKEELTPEQFEICRNKGTDIPFTGKYTNCKRQGIYHCICCGNSLFDSSAKFESRSGWPSFFDAVSTDNVNQIKDDSHGMNRVEVTCNACNSHLGHVFDDGPEPTGLRFCINSTALKLKSKT
jgi:peptide-methionine (R)-S-oxide reductase